MSGVTDSSCSYQYLADFLTVSYLQYTLRIVFRNIQFSREGRGVCLPEFHPVTVLFWIALLRSPSHCHSRSLNDVFMWENYCELYNTERFKGENNTIKSIDAEKAFNKISPGFRNGKSISLSDKNHLPRNKSNHMFNGKTLEI